MAAVRVGVLGTREPSLTAYTRLFPLSVRAVGSGMAAATNWASNFVVGITFLPMMEMLTPMATFALYAAVCVAGWLTVWNIYPETCGLSLEDVGELLWDGWNVEESKRRAMERKRQRRAQRADEQSLEPGL